MTESVAQLASKAILSQLREDLTGICQKLESGGRHLSRYEFYAINALAYIPIAQDRCPNDPFVSEHSRQLRRLANRIFAHYE